jgi:phosphatidylglycerophosphate synthase
MRSMGNGQPQSETWKTKPTDRFVLKWIKCNLSSRITPRLIRHGWLRPWMITVVSAVLGMVGGGIYALGAGWLAGLIAALAQVLDGVDGQFARLTERESPAGALCDSVLDRFADGAMVIGMSIYLARIAVMPLWLLIVCGALALMGSNAVSYSTARAETLGIDLGKPTLASKGTRSTVMILCAMGTVVWPSLPVLALMYLVIHPNLVVVGRLVKACKSYGADCGERGR